MSQSDSLTSIVIKYILKWGVFFMLLLWWTTGHPNFNWLWIPSVVLFSIGLIAIYAAKKVGDKIVDHIEEKLEETSETEEVSSASDSENPT